MKQSKMLFNTQRYLPDQIRVSIESLSSQKGVVFLSFIYSFAITALLIFQASSYHDVYSYRTLSPGAPIVLFSLIWAGLPSIWMPNRILRPTQILYWFLYLLAYIPSVIVPSFVFRSPSRFVPAYLALAAGMFIISLSYRVRLIHINREVFSNNRFWLVITSLIMLMFLIVHLRIGIAPRVLATGDVHVARRLFHASTEGRVGAYMFMWLKNVIAPLILAIGFGWRDRRLVVIGIVVSVLVFMTGGHRSALFVPVGILGLVIMLNHRKSVIPVYLCGGMVGSIIAGITIGLISSIHQPVTLLRRLLLAQGKNMGAYIDFFSNPANPLVMLSNRAFVALPYPYDQPVAAIIGAEYYPRLESTYANSHLWADGYAMFGLFGIILFSALLGFVFWLYDSFSFPLNDNIAILLLVGQVIIVTNTPIFTMLITHGFGFGLCIVFLLGMLRINQRMESSISVKNS